MKNKWVALCLMLCCLVSMYAPAQAFDLSPFQSDDNFSIDVDSDKELAFIETTITPQQLSFAHSKESDYHYSNARSDLLVVDYFSSSRSALMRTWIYYYGSEYLYISAVSFDIDGKRYTFSDVSNKEYRTQNENDFSEDLLIKYGTDNVDFFVALVEKASQMKEDANTLSQDEFINNVDNYSIKMTLHGVQDEEVTLGAYFLMDFYIMSNGYFNSGATDDFASYSGTPMKVTELTAQ